jgi:hypothetical protein
MFCPPGSPVRMPGAYQKTPAVCSGERPRTANKTGIDAVMYQLDGRMYYYRANSISNNDAMTRNRENDGKGISVEEWHK